MKAIRFKKIEGLVVTKEGPDLSHKNSIKRSKKLYSFLKKANIIHLLVILIISFFTSNYFFKSTAFAENINEENSVNNTNQNQKNYSDVFWAEKEQRKSYDLTKTSNKDLKEAKSIVSKNSALNQPDLAWAQKEVLKSESMTIDTHDSNKSTKNGINIDHLITTYANKMPKAQNIVSHPFQDLFIFVSFSMPENSLKQWMMQAQEAGGVLVVRGLVNNSFKETAKQVSKLIGKNQGGVEIDPTLFKRFDIQSVPAVVVLKNSMGPCLNPQGGCPTPLFDVVYGDIPLSKALEEIERKGEVASEKASLILLHMGEDHE